MKVSSALLSFAAAVAAHGYHDHDQELLEGPHEGLWYNTLPGDGGTQVCCLGLPCKLRMSN
jgi:agmatinase